MLGVSPSYSNHMSMKEPLGDARQAATNPVTGVAGRLETWSRTILAAVGLTYGLGMLVVMLYLAPYGVASTSLVRAQYVLAGNLLFLAPLATVRSPWTTFLVL